MTFYAVCHGRREAAAAQCPYHHTFKPDSLSLSDNAYRTEYREISYIQLYVSNNAAVSDL